MDERKDFHAVKRERDNGQVSDVLIRHGNWVVKVSKNGLCVQSTVAREAYHFIKDSNGWITGESTSGLVAIKSNGQFGGVPQKYDQEVVALHNFS